MSYSQTQAVQNRQTQNSQSKQNRLTEKAVLSRQTQKTKDRKADKWISEDGNWAAKWQRNSKASSSWNSYSGITVHGCVQSRKNTKSGMEARQTHHKPTNIKLEFHRWMYWAEASEIGGIEYFWKLGHKPSIKIAYYQELARQTMHAIQKKVSLKHSATNSSHSRIRPLGH